MSSSLDQSYSTTCTGYLTDQFLLCILTEVPPLCSCSPVYSRSQVCTATINHWPCSPVYKSLTMPNILSHCVKLYAEGLALSPGCPHSLLCQFTFSIIRESDTSTPCIILNTNWRTNNGGGLGRRLRGASSDDQQTWARYSGSNECSLNNGPKQGLLA